MSLVGLPQNLTRNSSSKYGWMNVPFRNTHNTGKGDLLFAPSFFYAYSKQGYMKFSS